MTADAIIKIVVEGIRGLILLGEALGHRDAVIAALDAELAASRALVDRALVEKHR